MIKIGTMHFIAMITAWIIAIATGLTIITEGKSTFIAVKTA